MNKYGRLDDDIHLRLQVDIEVLLYFIFPLFCQLGGIPNFCSH